MSQRDRKGLVQFLQVAVSIRSAPEIQTLSCGYKRAKDIWAYITTDLWSTSFVFRHKQIPRDVRIKEIMRFDDCATDIGMRRRNYCTIPRGRLNEKAVIIIRDVIDSQNGSRKDRV
jgi:hypothetical protein